ncbi:MAG: hypothetical protein R3E79_60165 [Caldilineaceae bacterium]
MTVKFSRSVRSIQADNLVPVLVGISFFTLLMVGWIIWFFFAQVPTYVTSSTAVYQQTGYVLAEFPAPAIEQIRRGQPARLQLPTTNQSSQMIPLVVTDVDSAAGQVRLILQIDDEDFTRLPVGATGEVQVVVKQDSPALFVLRAAGLWPET